MNQYVRCYEPPDSVPEFKRTKAALPRTVLVFDTETTTDRTQTFRVGAYQLRVDGALVQAGVFYPGETLDAFRRLVVNTSRERDAALVGFNLPFDIARIAPEFGEARGQMLGGFSFGLVPGWGTRLRTKHLGGRKTLFRWSGDPAPKGAVIDVAMLGKAITGRSHSLASLGRALGIKSEKLSTTHGGEIDSAYLDYLQRDVTSTWQCYEALVKIWTSWRLEYTHVQRVYSEASVGKGALRQMNVRPFSEMQTNVTEAHLAAAMEAFYGGRSEVHIRRQPEPITYVDYLSMYPTVCALMGLWNYVRARRIDAEDYTAGATETLRKVSLSGMLKPESWSQLPCFVRVESAGDLFPVRADYAESGVSIGLNRLHANEPIWYTLADCIASTLLTGKPPKVVQAFRLRATGKQSKLHAWEVLGRSEYRIDPAKGDFYRRAVELRATMQGDERDAMKRVINSVCYGIFAELNEQPNDDRQRRFVCGSGEDLSYTRRKAETPGLYHNPFLAALITGAARLMLATLERQVIDSGLDWVFCDTDSSAIVTRTADDITSVMDIVSRYSALNPYREPIGNILKVEHGGNAERPVYAYAISAKRYALCRISGSSANRGNSRRVEIVKASAHGLGHLRPPDGRKEREAEAPKWLIPVWQELIAADGFRRQKPVFRGAILNTPAMSQFTVTSPAMIRYGMQPYSFAGIFRVSLSCPWPNDGVAVADFDSNPKVAAKSAVIAGTGQPVEVADLRTYREAFDLYWEHPESKFVGGDSRGVLSRRNVWPSKRVYIGKEGGKLEEQAHGLYVEQQPYGARTDVQTLKSRW